MRPTHSLFETMQDEKSNSGAALLKPIKAFGERASDFRTIHCDGVWAIPGADGGIYLVLYSEHLPMPDVISQDLDPSTGAPTGRPTMETKQQFDPRFWNVIRTHQAEVGLPFAAAEQLYHVLGAYLAQVKGGQK